MKKIVSALLCAAMLTLTAFAYTPASSVEVDDSASVFFYVDDVSDAESQSLTEIGAEVGGTSWRMRNAEETPDGLKAHTADTPAKFGINNEGYLFVDAVFDSVQVYNADVSKTIPALVLAEDLSGLSADHQITFDVKKVHNQTVTTGIRFMVHNGGKNYYALIFGGNNYNNGSGLAGWQLVKCEDGVVKTLKEGGHTNYPGYSVMKNGVEVFWSVVITVTGNEISFAATQVGNSTNTIEASCTDEEKFDVSGNDAGVWLMAMNGNNNPARNAVFRNFTIKSYVPYLTAPEPDEIMYFDTAEGKAADADGVISLSMQAPIRKVVAESKANQTVNIYLSKDKTEWDEVTGASFDENGVWLNNKSIQEYSYIAFEPNIDGSISALTEVTEEAVLELPLKTTLHLYPKAGDVTEASAFTWTTDREEVATVTDGEVELLRKGDVTIRAEKDSTSFICKISVIGEIEAAIKNNTVAEYIASVKPVFDEINRAIKEKDTDGLKAVFNNTGAVKLESIVDIDAQKIAELDADKLEEFIAQIMTYESFPCEDTDDVYYLADAIDTEYAVGLLNDLTDYSQMISALEQQNIYLGLDLENAYYKKYTNDAASRLCSDEFTNADDLKYKYKQAYVMAGLKNALSPDMVEKLLADCDTEIGYDKTHFIDVKSVALYEAIIEEKATLNDLDKLSKFIDEYTKPTEPTGDGNSGGGGGGGGGLGISRPALNINVDNETVNEINEKTLVTPEPIAAFPDLAEDHWAYDSVMALKVRGIINGYEDGFFRPDNIVRRAEFVKMLMLALDIEAEDAADTTDFSDVSAEDWYYEAVMLAAQNNIISGYPDGSFRPDAIVTREEMAAMLYRAYKEHIVEAAKDGAEVMFTDADSIAEWAAEAVEALSRADILAGDENLRFGPSRGATRAETAKCISALL